MTGGARLVARVSLLRNNFSLDVGFEVEPGEVLAILGPNGSGKSTVLSILAGLVQPDRGRIILDDVVLTSVGGTEPEIRMPVERRSVGLLGQDPLVFPHLDVAGNVGFGPRAAGQSRRAAKRTAQEWLEAMGLGALADRRPSELSGGQLQRVALARACAARPQVLLLDEPFSALDVEVASQIRHVTRDFLQRTGLTTVIVTHDVLDVAALADRIVVLDEGTVVDAGAVDRVLREPRSSFGARFAGVNLLRGKAEAGEVVTPGGVRVSGLGEVPDGAQVCVVFSPAAVQVHTVAPEGMSARNVWPMTIESVHPSSNGLRVSGRFLLPHAAGDHVNADITAAAMSELKLFPSQHVWFSLKASEVRVHRL